MRASTSLSMRLIEYAISGAAADAETPVLLILSEVEGRTMSVQPFVETSAFRYATARTR